MKWPLLDVQAGSLQSRQALKDARSPSPAHIVVSKRRKIFFLCLKKKKKGHLALIVLVVMSFLLHKPREKYFRKPKNPNEPMVKRGNAFAIAGLFMTLTFMCLGGEQRVENYLNLHTAELLSGSKVQLGWFTHLTMLN